VGWAENLVSESGVVSEYEKFGWSVRERESGRSWSGNGVVSGGHRNRSE